MMRPQKSAWELIGWVLAVGAVLVALILMAGTAEAAGRYADWPREEINTAPGPEAQEPERAYLGWMYVTGYDTCAAC